jgi:hypothetical protein
MPRKQDRWAEIVTKLGLDLTLPVNFLTATQIKVAVHEEPRLMASMDSEDSLPDVFRKSGIFVLPVSRSKYALVRGSGYHELEDPGKPVDFPVRLPFPLTSLEYGHGESRYLLHAYHSNLLSEFSGVTQLYPTVSGKMASSAFQLRIGGSPPLEIARAGMEIDFGFEGPDDLLLLEAKAVARKTFLVRQLFYPFRTFRDQGTKRVRPLFFVADPEAQVYSIWEYCWTDPGDYEAIHLRKARCYRLVEGPTIVERLASVSADRALDKIPQADDLSKVAEFPFLVQKGVRTAVDWSQKKGLTRRQGDYYREATEALGLIRSRAGKFELTEEGRRYVEMTPSDRDEMLAIRILRNPLMNEVFQLALARGSRGIDDETISDLIRQLSPLGGKTPLRRAKTVRSYFGWLAQATGVVVVESRKIYSREGWMTGGQREPTRT